MQNKPAPAFPVDLEPSTPDHFIYKLPKTEMHLHLEGSFSLDQYKQVVDVPSDWTPEGWQPNYQYPTFDHFEQFILGYGDKWFNSPQRYLESAKAIFEAKLREGVTYMECSFGVIVCQIHGLPIDEVIDAIKSVVPAELELRLHMGLHHNSWNPEMEKALTDALSIKQLDGIDLHGPEDFPIQDWLVDYWTAARSAGLHTKAHAGELGKAADVREAIEKLGVRRIEHGLRAVDDPEVVALLKEYNVVCDICPVSNYKLKASKDYASHPLRQLVDAGITCTINTDDPFIFGSTINDEFIVLDQQAGFSKAELLQLARNGFEQAMVTTEQKTKFLSDFDIAAKALI